MTLYSVYGTIQINNGNVFLRGVFIMAINNNNILWICPVCGHTNNSPYGSKPNGDAHCLNCPGIMVETKYRCGDYYGMPGYEDVSREQVFQEYVYNNEQYDPEIMEQWYQIDCGGSGSSSFISEQNDNKPKCPTCGSTNIRKISTLNRAVSIGTLGLLSGKIGKNYECLNCKAKW